MSRKMRKMTAERLDFFTNVSHELRTPITLIIGPIERALKISTNPYVIEQLSFAERNSKYLLTLINQLMDFRKIESNRLEIAYTRGNFVDFMESIISSFDFQTNDREIRLLKRYHLVNPVFHYDEEGLRKVMFNLISNAIEYTPNGGEIIVYVKSFKDATTNENKLYLSVKDNGVGIPEEEKEKVFRRFYQSKPPRYPVNGQSGTGIGLYLTSRSWKPLGEQLELKTTARRRLFPRHPTLHEENPHSLTPKTATGHEPVKNVLKEQNLKEWQKRGLPSLWWKTTGTCAATSARCYRLLQHAGG